MKDRINKTSEAIQAIVWKRNKLVDAKALNQEPRTKGPNAMGLDGNPHPQVEVVLVKL